MYFAFHTSTLFLLILPSPSSYLFLLNFLMFHFCLTSLSIVFFLFFFFSLNDLFLLWLLCLSSPVICLPCCCLLPALLFCPGLGSAAGKAYGIQGHPYCAVGVSSGLVCVCAFVCVPTPTQIMCSYGPMDVDKSSSVLFCRRWMWWFVSCTFPTQQYLCVYAAVLIECLPLCPRVACLCNHPLMSCRRWYTRRYKKRNNIVLSCTRYPWYCQLQ